jgi:tetratricopeptide (TPR) repeat protein
VRPVWRSVAATGLYLVSAVVRASVVADLTPIPQPNLTQVEAAVAEQLTALLADLDAALGMDPPDPEGLLLAYTELGQTYLAYSLLEPGGVAIENAMLLSPQDYRWPYLLARVAQETIDLERAEDLLTRVLELDPGYLPAFIRFGELELERQNLEAAATWYEQALEMAPGSPAANYGLAQIAMRQERPEEAVALFEKVLELQPSANAVHYALGLAYRDVGDRAKAREHLALRGEIAVKTYDPLADALAQRVRGAGLYITRGSLALTAGNHQLAIQAYGKAVAAAPDNLVALQGLANAHARAGQTDRAISLYEQTVEASPGNSVILYNLGTLLSEVGREQEAEAAFRRALEIAPDLTDARFNLALMHERRDDWAAALAQYDAILELEPEDLEAAVRRAGALAHLGRGDEARSELTSILGRDPKMGSAFIALGKAYELDGDGDGAERSFRRALAESADETDRAQAAYLLGVVLQASRPSEAIEAFRIASRLAPDVAAAHFSLALVLGREGRFEASAGAYDAGLAIEPENSQAHVGRAMAALLAGQERRALAALEQSLERSADSITLRHLLARLLATSTDASVRDADRALRLAQQIMQSQPGLDHGETLAMALAEAGRFDEAAAMQEQVLQRALETGRTGSLPLIELRLAGYRAGQPVRSPWND